AAGDCGDQADLGAGLERGLEIVDLRAVDVDVHERTQAAALVEKEIADRQPAQRLAHGRGVCLESAFAARLPREQRGEQDHCHSVASTERIVGRKRAASTHDSPASGETKTEPLWTPA